MQLDGQVAIITGAGAGIGEAAALRLARAGARIGAMDLDADEVGQTVRQITRAKGEAIELPADVSKPEQVQKAVRRAAEEWGRLDVVFANAGINGVWAPIEELEPDEWDRTLDTNLKGTYLTIKYAVPYLKKQERGSIIITSSVNGTRIFSNTGATAYSCSKAGQVAMARMLAVELGQWHIRVNVICPGAIETQIGESTEQRNLDKVKTRVEFPEGGKIPVSDDRPGHAEQVADLVLFLASDASSHISGTEVWIDGAQSLLQG